MKVVGELLGLVATWQTRTVKELRFWQQLKDLYPSSKTWVWIYWINTAAPVSKKRSHDLAY